MAKDGTTRKTGDIGESAAAAYLRKKGYEIIDKNFRSRYGEVDIIAGKGEIIAFVEVKTRNTNSIDRPAMWVDKRKQQRIIKTAVMYFKKTGVRKTPRFDVIEVSIDKNTSIIVDLNHIESAFITDGSIYAF